MRSIRPSRSAFTLIEILVALAIMVIVVGCTYGIYIAATQSATRYRARGEVEREARTLLRMMSREIRGSYFPSANDLSPTVQSSPANTSGAPTPSAPATAPANTPDTTITRSDRPARAYLGGTAGGDSLQTLTTGGISDPDQPGSGLCNVVYRLDHGKKMIFRRQLDLLEPPDSKAQDLDWRCVARGVETVKYTFFDGKAWTDSWSSGSNTGLPYAVKIEITLKDAEGRLCQYAASVNVPLAAAPLAQSTVAAPAPKTH